MAERVKVISKQSHQEFQQEVEEALAEITEISTWHEIVYSTNTSPEYTDPDYLTTEYTAFIHYSVDEQEGGCYPC